MTPTLAASVTNLLKASAPVAALCGTRIYPDRAPDKASLPYVVYSELITTSEESHDDANGLDGSQLQFSCYALTTLEAISLRSAVRLTILAPGASLGGAKATQPTSRTLPADEIRLANASLEVTFMHNPTH